MRKLPTRELWAYEAQLEEQYLRAKDPQEIQYINDQLTLICDLYNEICIDTVPNGDFEDRY